MARDMDVPFLGSIPMDNGVVEASDSGVPFVSAHPDSAATSAFQRVLTALLDKHQDEESEVEP